MGRFCRTKTIWLKNWMITTFIKKYQVNISEAVYTGLEAYPHFNSFFTRHLRSGTRPIAANPHAIVSPADGSISQFGHIEKDLLIQAKKFNFKLEQLLADQTLATKFLNGEFFTCYLAPKDYHRVHMPLAGKLIKTIFIPGKLFSVNEETALNVPNLFARNERLVCIFETAAGLMAMIFVGAMLVGSIKTVWQDHPHTAKKVSPNDFSEPLEFQKGDEVGHFQMGSTIILLFQQNTIRWQNFLCTLLPIKMGQTIAELEQK